MMYWGPKCIILGGETDEEVDEEGASPQGGRAATQGRGGRGRRQRGGGQGGVLPSPYPCIEISPSDHRKMCKT